LLAEIQLSFKLFGKLTHVTINMLTLSWLCKNALGILKQPDGLVQQNRFHSLYMFAD